jgi:hypothetical protein
MAGCQRWLTIGTLPRIQRDLEKYISANFELALDWRKRTSGVPVQVTRLHPGLRAGHPFSETVLSLAWLHSPCWSSEMVHLVVEDHSPIPDACFQAALIILLPSTTGGSLEWLCVVQTHAYHRTDMY